jgi:ParB family chromosome partitioning protein
MAAQSVVLVDPDLIVPNPAQPRSEFAKERIEALADSIAHHGILNPLLVRRVGEKYELIAGERRLRASRIAGLDRVPCIIRESGETDSAILAIIENLQREDLNMFEEADAIRSLIETCGLTQESAAGHLSCSQSYVANKLRLLKLLPLERRAILEHGLTERHARALLRLRDREIREKTLEVIIGRSMNVAATEEYIEELLCAEARAVSREKVQRFERDVRRRLLSRDMRLFYNSIDRAVESVRECGFAVESTREAVDGGTKISIYIMEGK